jgi:hypothetical protein
MNRGKVTFLSVAAAVLLAAVLMASVWFTYFAGRQAGFQLPDPLPPGSGAGEATPGAGPGTSGHTPLVVDAGNIQALLETVERPEAYSQVIECISYWTGGEETVTHHFYRRGELTRTQTLRRGFSAQNRITAPERTYVWTEGTMIVEEVFPEDTDAESLSGIPTWETVAGAPPDSVLEAEYLYTPGERCLVVRTREPVYQAEYIVSLETGLLLRAAFFNDDGTLAYIVNAGPPAEGNPGNEYFTLPNGQLLG